MLKYEYINNKEQLAEFVENLNKLTIHEKHLLFVEIFRPRILDLSPKEFPRNSKINFQKWWFAVKTFHVYATIKINKRLPIEKPEFNSGFYEEIYFHLNKNDYSGISQTIT